jgi:hypothetical protein
LIDDGKEQLLAAFRAFAAWAGIERAGAEPLRWVPSERAESAESAFSGALQVGFVELARHAPPSGPHWHHAPHWMLTVVTAPDQAPFACAGWADSMDGARAALTDAWSAYLAWCGLPALKPAP